MAHPLQQGTKRVSVFTGADENNGGTQVSTSNLFPVTNTPFSTYENEIALGRVENAEFLTIFGTNSVGQGIANDTCIGDGQTGRYKFPLAAAQMTIVSTSNNDTLGGTGVNIILIRGILGDGSELFEAFLMTGTTPSNTTNSFYRINDIIAVSVGTAKLNVGTITLKNGTDLLAQMNPNTNISRTMVRTIPLGVTGIVKGSYINAGKDESAVSEVHIYPSSIGNIELVPFSQKTYQDQIISNREGNFTLLERTDVEITGYSEGGTNSTIQAQLDMLLVDN